MRDGASIDQECVWAEMSHIRLRYQACRTAEGARVHITGDPDRIKDGYASTVCGRTVVDAIKGTISREMFCQRCVKPLAFSADDFTTRELGVRKIVG
jgi:hypothetical protein